MSDRNKSILQGVVGWLGFGGICTLALVLWNTSAGVTNVRGKVDNCERRINTLESTGGVIVEKHLEVDKELKREATERFQRIEAQMSDLPEMKADIKQILKQMDKKP